MSEKSGVLLLVLLLACRCATGVKIATDAVPDERCTIVPAGSNGEQAAYRYGTALTVVYFGEKDWVAYTDKGFYDCTPGAERHLHFVRGIDVVSMKECRERYYVPGLRKIVAGGDR